MVEVELFDTAPDLSISGKYNKYGEDFVVSEKKAMKLTATNIEEAKSMAQRCKIYADKKDKGIVVYRKSNVVWLMRG